MVVAEEQLYLVDILAGYYAKIVEELRAGYYAVLVLAEEQLSSLNSLVGYFDEKVGFQVVDCSGAIVEE